MVDKHPPFGAWLRQRRKALDWTQAELAQQVGCSVRTIEKLESGARRPSKQLAELLACRLRIDEPDAAIFIRLGRGVSDSPPSESWAAATQHGHLARRHTLPTPTTAFVGRAAQVAAAGAILRRPHTRLLTLIGTGGIGKTRLAIEIAQRLLDDFVDGVCFVALAALRDPDLLLPTIAHALALQDEGRLSPRERVTRALSHKAVLLVLDNFEQIVAAAPVVSDLLAACPRLTIIVTSREPLRIRGEHQVIVPPLSLPDSQAGALTPEAAECAEALRLFVDRARELALDFALTPENAAPIAAICSRLDGVPLAIELAVARLRHLSLQELLARLEHRLDVLADGPRDLPARQQTLRDTIAWSYALLDAGEQQLFRRLSVFVGGCAPEAVAAICFGGEAQSHTARAQLESLIDKSLLQYALRAADEPRFEMLETIREYAFELLEASGEADQLRRAHAAYYLQLVERAGPELYRSQQRAWFDRLELEHDNLRAVLDWSHAAGQDQRVGLPIAGILGWLWEVRGYFLEGRARLDRVLAATEGDISAARARALGAAARLAMVGQNYDERHALADASLRVWRAVGDEHGVSQAHYNRGVIALEDGCLDLAVEHFEAARALAEKLGDTRGMAHAIGCLGFAAFGSGDLATAQEQLIHSRRLLEAVADSWGLAWYYDMHGLLAFARHDYRLARTLLGEGLRRFIELRVVRGVHEALTGLALAAYGEGDLERAVRLMAVAEREREASGAVVPLLLQHNRDELVRVTQRLLGNSRWQDLWRSGHALPIEAALADALAPLSHAASEAPDV